MTRGIKGKQPCTVDGCEKAHYARGWCSKHYALWWRTGHLMPRHPRGESRRRCLVEGCEQFIRGQGLCYTHWRRQRLYGDPMGSAYARRVIPIGLVSPTEIGKQLGVSRQRAHQLLNKQKHQARSLLWHAVRRGEIIKPTVCMMCRVENGDLEGHHLDYEFPLLVVWVCTSCHTRIHPHPPAPRDSLPIRSQPEGVA